MAAPPRRCDRFVMHTLNANGWAAAEAQLAFDKAVRARRRAALRRFFRRCCAECARLSGLGGSSGSGERGLRDIPLDAIAGSLEPNRSAMFDGEFRPSRSARSRWISIWMAEHRGTVLPPISVSAVGGGYAVRDGHHRISVARARGALTIAALVA
jgi:hypothetical protein